MAAPNRLCFLFRCNRRGAAWTAKVPKRNSKRVNEAILVINFVFIRRLDGISKCFPHFINKDPLLKTIVYGFLNGIKCSDSVADEGLWKRYVRPPRATRKRENRFNLFLFFLFSPFFPLSTKLLTLFIPVFFVFFFF